MEDDFNLSINKFYYNFSCIIHSSLITIETMFEFIAYINKNQLVELYFVEIYYLPLYYEFFYDFYDNEEEMVCSFIELVSFYRKKIIENDTEIITILNKLHYKSKKFLENNDVKDKLKKILYNYKVNDENNKYISMIKVISHYIQEYPDTRPNIVSILNTAVIQNKIS